MQRALLMAGLVGFALLLPGARQARTDSNTHGRVSAVERNLLVRGAGDDDWSYLERNGVADDGDSLWADEESLAEIEMEGGAWLRLGPDTRVEVRRLPPDGDLRLERGSLYVDLSREMREGLRVRTAPGEVQMEAGALARVDLGQSDEVRILVGRGQLTVRPAETEERRLNEGEMALMRPDEPQVEVSRLDSASPDAFDRWNEQRVAYYAGRSLPTGVERRLPGIAELGDYGDWLTVEGNQYWRPRRVAEDWAPYSVGYWTYWQKGPLWMPYEPWGYTTYHYGRWWWRANYGWLWRPAYVWGPAWVAWANYGDYLLWAPLDWWGSPCTVGVPYYAGELRVDPYVWSVMARSDLYRRDRRRVGRLHRHREFDHRRIRALPEPHRLAGDLARGGRIRGRFTTDTAPGPAPDRFRSLERLPRRSDFRVPTSHPRGGTREPAPRSVQPPEPRVRRTPAMITPPPPPSGTRRTPRTGNPGRTRGTTGGGVRLPAAGGNRGRGDSSGGGPGRTRGGGARGVPPATGGGFRRAPATGGGPRRPSTVGGSRSRPPTFGGGHTRPPTFGGRHRGVRRSGPHRRQFQGSGRQQDPARSTGGTSGRTLGNGNSRGSSARSARGRTYRRSGNGPRSRGKQSHGRSPARPRS